MVSKGRKPLTILERKQIELAHQSNIQNKLFGVDEISDLSKVQKEIENSANASVGPKHQRAKTRHLTGSFL
jgi:hypothetical protein